MSKSRGRAVVGALTLVAMVAVYIAVAASTVLAALPYGVTSNVLCDKVTQESDGSYKAGKIVAYFRTGTTEFESLTQMYFVNSGKYQLTFEIKDAEGKIIKIAGPISISWPSDDWTHSQPVKWRVTFNKAGTYYFVVRIGKDVIGSFLIMVKN